MLRYKLFAFFPAVLAPDGPWWDLRHFLRNSLSDLCWQTVARRGGGSLWQVPLRFDEAHAACTKLFIGIWSRLGRNSLPSSPPSDVCECAFINVANWENLHLELVTLTNRQSFKGLPSSWLLLGELAKLAFIGSRWISRSVDMEKGDKRVVIHEDRSLSNTLPSIILKARTSLIPVANKRHLAGCHAWRGWSEVQCGRVLQISRQLKSRPGCNRDLNVNPGMLPCEDRPVTYTPVLKHSPRWQRITLIGCLQM